MPPIAPWQVRRPRWVACLAWTLGAAVTACAGYASPWLLLPAVFVLWCWRHHPRLGLFAPAGLLYANNQGGWEFVQDGVSRSLVLSHIWPGPLWTALRFGASPLDDQKDGMLELTIWKSSVMPQAWRDLQMLAAREQAGSRTPAMREAG